MKLIIESGATKTQWAVLDGKEVVDNFYTPGINPYYLGAEEIHDLVDEAIPDSFADLTVTQIFFYGTGCSTPENCVLVKAVLGNFFKEASISVQHDLDGAALALLKDKKGIACILGTGSNSCLWNGHEIVEKVPSLGYFLGDEGSGTFVGKLLLKAFLSGDVNEELTKKFYTYVGMNFSEILHKIYKDSLANLWVAGLAKFASANIHEPVIQHIVRHNFQEFVSQQLTKYTDYQELEISFVGSVAFYFQDILSEVLAEHHLKMGRVSQAPMEGLIEFHTRNSFN